MKKLTCIAFALLVSQASIAQLAPEELKGYQNLLLSAARNPLRDCADAGLEQLYVYRVYHLGKKTDADIEQAQLAGAQDEASRIDVQRQLRVWTQTHQPHVVAQVKFDVCLLQARVATTDAQRRLHRHCFDNSLFAVDVMRAKDNKEPAVEVKARMARAKLALSRDQANSYIDEMFAAPGRKEELGLARELFSSCIDANNGRY